MKPEREAAPGVMQRLGLYGAGVVRDALLADPTELDAHDNRDWELPDEWIHDGSVIDLTDRRLTAVHTPGHTRGHIVFVYRGEVTAFVKAGTTNDRSIARIPFTV